MTAAAQPDLAALTAAVDAVLPATLVDLETLVAVPSISSMPEHAADVQRTADLIADWLRDIGAASVEVVSEGGAPAVIAHFPGPDGTPTVCLYAHHDVQPPGDLSLWSTAPFSAAERGGRLYGRGSADDKGGVAVHLATLRAFGGKPPVGVKLFIEGEEEVGSPTLTRILDKHHDLLVADVFVIADSTNWEAGRPAFTTRLRGIADCVVEVRTLASGIHSGEYGGVVPDALTALCRLLATLHDDAGNVAIEGLLSTKAPELDYPLDRLAEETGLVQGVAFIGDGSVVERIWTKPAVSVIALDTTRIADASNTLIPAARAKVSLRVAPGQTADEALGALIRHLESHAPWGAQVTVTPGHTGQPGIIDFEGAVCDSAFESMHEAFGVEPVFIGCGGSIPMVAEFQRTFPDATVLVTAVTDPTSAMHGIDESVQLSDVRAAAVTEAGLLTRLAAAAGR